MRRQRNAIGGAGFSGSEQRRASFPGAGQCETGGLCPGVHAGISFGRREREARGVAG